VLRTSLLIEFKFKLTIAEKKVSAVFIEEEDRIARSIQHINRNLSFIELQTCRPI
jgi:hypothetical protein